ncbi:Protein HupE [Rhodovastum atsumiense]|uniref:HupE/UreJ family protein n=1 Tax=Rhodovastum atsumiense TaxID=504468 RepID=A0A5M6IM80_9PROT|nr:HupE/UreJ family protein [Rhodovastum atsumiense]KAA5609394.1 HupE/UreJ family protein [Rhodovastum atsumiense]CAH2601851.1 Protein HupE [Rhodovastum atsumiense]
MTSIRSASLWPAVVAMTLLAFPAAAHEQIGVAGGLSSGLLHPLTGLDHLVAMVAVGIWGAQLGNPAIWVLPITFPLVMAVGGVLGVLGVPLPLTEVVVAASGIALGGAVALSLRTPLWLAGLVVGAFAIFHGHAHGMELPHAANPFAYGLGFVVATGCLHLCGILIGVALRWPFGARLIRGVGMAIAVVGCFFLYSSLVGEG